MTASQETILEARVGHTNSPDLTRERRTGGVLLASHSPLSFDDGRGNWLWLADISRWDRALEVRSDIGPQTAGLAEHFRSVHCLRLDRSLLRREWQDLIDSGYANIVAACATPVHLPYRDGAFDCVALDDVSPLARQDQVLGESCR